jgi:hypothetical protein
MYDPDGSQIAEDDRDLGHKIIRSHIYVTTNKPSSFEYTSRLFRKKKLVTELEKIG